MERYELRLQKIMFLVLLSHGWSIFAPAHTTYNGWFDLVLTGSGFMFAYSTLGDRARTTRALTIFIIPPVGAYIASMLITILCYAFIEGRGFVFAMDAMGIIVIPVIFNAVVHILLGFLGGSFYRALFG